MSADHAGGGAEYAGARDRCGRATARHCGAAAALRASAIMRSVAAARRPRRLSAGLLAALAVAAILAALTPPQSTARAASADATAAAAALPTMESGGGGGGGMPVGPAVPAAVPSKSQHAAHGRQLSQHAAHRQHGRQLSQHAAHATHDGRSRTQQHSQLHEMIPQHAEWKAYYHHLCGLSIAGQPLCGLLTHLIQWKFSLTPTQLRRAAAHVGPNHRLRRVVRDLITGHAQVNIGVIGTSVSFGTGAAAETTGLQTGLVSELMGLADWLRLRLSVY
eukprot:363873-Chlamydomonas_euryale.AAC.18